MLTRLLAIATLCTATACDSDTTTPDAALSVDAPGTAFQCGSHGTCDSATQYCYEQSGGLFAPATPGCNDIPPSCSPPVNCDCLELEVTDCGGGNLTCMQDGDAFILMCSLP